MSTVYSQKNSRARFGQTIFDNGGVLDDCIFFDRNDRIVDFLNDWNDEDPLDGLEELIEYRNYLIEVS